MGKIAVMAAMVCLLTGCANFGGDISPLIMAARQGDTARLKELVKAGADVNQRGGVNNWTPLMHAIHKDQIASVRLLVDSGADVNASAGSQTALIMAAGYGYADIVRMLLDNGADPHGALDAAVSGSSDMDRLTAGKCQTDTVKALLAKDHSLHLPQDSWALRTAKLSGCTEVLALLGN